MYLENQRLFEKKIYSKVVKQITWNNLDFFQSEIQSSFEDNREIIDPCFKVEYAIEAIKLGSTAIGIQTKEGNFSYLEKVEK